MSRETVKWTEVEDRVADIAHEAIDSGTDPEDVIEALEIVADEITDRMHEDEADREVSR